MEFLHRYPRCNGGRAGPTPEKAGCEGAGRPEAGEIPAIWIGNRPSLGAEAGEINIKPPVKGQTYFIRQKYDRGGLKRLVILKVTDDTVSTQQLMDDGSPIVDPVPFPKNRNRAATFFNTMPIQKWNRIRQYWQLKIPEWAKKYG